MTRQQVRIRVPGTTSNLGPGFDTLGVALNLHNEITLKRRPGPSIVLAPSRTGANQAGANAMIAEAARFFFHHARVRTFGFETALAGEVPIARGLGSSVTVRLGVIAGLAALAGVPVEKDLLLNWLTALEHHPDNAAPALYGGLTVAGILPGGETRCLRIPLPRSLKFVALIPRFEVSTAQARALVPARFSREDTVHNLNRAALIAAAMARGEFEMLAGLFEDRVHQPYRQKLIPPLFDVIRAGEKAGALGGWLSGSGSTIICLTLRNEQAVAAAMLGRLNDAEVRILRADPGGMKIHPG